MGEYSGLFNSISYINNSYINNYDTYNMTSKMKKTLNEAFKPFYPKSGLFPTANFTDEQWVAFSLFLEKLEILGLSTCIDNTGYFCKIGNVDPETLVRSDGAVYGYRIGNTQNNDTYDKSNNQSLLYLNSIDVVINYQNYNNYRFYDENTNDFTKQITLSRDLIAISFNYFTSYDNTKLPRVAKIRPNGFGLKVKVDLFDTDLKKYEVIKLFSSGVEFNPNTYSEQVIIPYDFFIIQSLYKNGFISYPAFGKKANYDTQLEVWLVCTLDEFKNLFANLGVHATINVSDMSLPFEDWQFGNKELLEDIPGSGGQEGGQTGGGEGTGDDTSEPIDLGNERTGCSELCTSYALSYGELEELNLALLNGNLWKDYFDNLFNPTGAIFYQDPKQGIINVLSFPFNIAKYDESNVEYKEAIQILNTKLEWTGGSCSGYKIKHNYKTRIEMGSIKFEEFYGSFLDYDPYTKITIYLPYFGYFPVPTDLVMGKTLRVYYNVSFTDGTALAVLLADEKPIANYQGKLGYQVPLYSSNTADMVQGTITSAVRMVAGVKFGGGSNTTLSETNQDQTIDINPVTNTVSALGGKSTVNIGGQTEGVQGRAMSPIPFVIIERPVTNMPQGYGNIAGWQTNLYDTLSSVSGYTECANVKTNGISSATDSEKEMIKTLLTNGVII